jgi:hypothetical protein
MFLIVGLRSDRASDAIEELAIGVILLGTATFLYRRFLPVHIPAVPETEKRKPRN